MLFILVYKSAQKITKLFADKLHYIVLLYPSGQIFFGFWIIVLILKISSWIPIDITSHTWHHSFHCIHISSITILTIRQGAKRSSLTLLSNLLVATLHVNISFSLSSSFCINNVLLPVIETIWFILIKLILSVVITKNSYKFLLTFQYYHQDLHPNLLKMNFFNLPHHHRTHRRQRLHHGDSCLIYCCLC